MRSYCKWILIPAVLLVFGLAIPEKADAGGWGISIGPGYYGHSGYGHSGYGHSGYGHSVYSHSGHGYVRQSYTPYRYPSRSLHYDVVPHYDHYDAVPHVTHNHGYYRHGRGHVVRRSYGHHGYYGH